MKRQDSSRTRAGVLATGAAALLILALTGCGIGRPTSPERVSEAATKYLNALAAGDVARACAELTPRADGATCARAIREHGSRLDARALRAAADASMDIEVHGNAATATLAGPRGARLVLARIGDRWRIDSGYAVPPRARTRPAEPAIVGGGRLVDIGGRALYLKCVGSGTPTVVLEAGFGGSSDDWRDVQRRLARTTRTCAYDRAGLGSSLPMPGVHDAGDEVRDLRRLLDAAGVARPYVLVGHSYGGLLVRLFARAHPAAVGGVVLVDAMGRDQTRRQLAIWPESTAPAVRRDVARPVRDGVDLAAGEAAARRIESLGSVPLAVITAGRHEMEWGGAPRGLVRGFDRLWTKMQDELATLSSDRVHVVALRSDHFVQRLDGQPGVVVRATDAVVSAARRHSRLPTCRQLFAGRGVRCR